MTKENLLKLLQGILVIGELEEPESYVLALVSKKQNLIIPMLRKSGVGTAYIDPTLFNDAQFEQLNTVVDTLNKERIFPIFKYTPKGKAAPAFNKTITKFVKPSGIKQILPEGCKAIFEAAGYTVVATDASDYPYTARNFGTQVEDDEVFKEQYETEKADLERKHIPYDHFDVDLEMQYKAIMSGSRPGVLLVGPAGVGKSEMTKAFAVRAKAHRIDIQLSPTTQPEDLEGQLVPDDTPGSQKNWKFEEGPVLKAWSKGYFLTAQEINFALAGANSCLNKYLDGSLYITIHNKTYHRHPNFVFMATMNAGYEDTEKLNQALKNRYSIVQLEPLTEQQFCDRVIAHTEFLGHKITDTFAKEIFKFSSFMQQQAKAAGWHENVEFGYRNAERFLDDIFLEPCDFAHFSSAVHAAYTNALSCDNNNTEKLMAFKRQEEVCNLIKQMFEYYDYSEAETTKVVDDFDELFVEPTPEEAEATEREDGAFGAIFDRFKTRD